MNNEGKLPNIGKKKLIILLLLGALGILLVVVGAFGGGDGKKSEKTVENTSDESYIDELENKIYNVIAKVTGDSDAVVVITCDGSIEHVYIANGDDEKEYVTIRTDNGYSPVLYRIVYPNITGVSVACRGGDDPATQKKLIDIISTALGISSNRICIVGTK